MGRSLRRCRDILVDFANLFKAFIGVNYLSIAFAIGQSGIALGIIGLLVIAITTVHGCHLLIKCKRTVIGRILDEQLPTGDGADSEGGGQRRRRLLNDLIEKRLSYGDVAFLTLGKAGLALVNFSLVITQFGFCVNYFIFLGNTFDKMFPEGSNDTAGALTTVAMTTVASGHHDGPGSVSAAVTPANVSPDVLVSTSPGYNILVLVPLPLFVLFAYLRSIRHMGPVSVVANLSVLIGYIAMITYLLMDFQISKDVVWFKFATFPIFFGQVTGSYEGIGTIIPIESSMEGNRHLFAPLLYLAILIFTSVLGSMGFLGYLRLGDATAQVLLWNLAPGSVLELVVSLVVCIGVVFTFPLQCFPVVEVLEELLFSPGKCCGPPLISEPSSINQDDEGIGDDPSMEVEFRGAADEGEKQTLLQDPQVTGILLKLPVASKIPQSVPTWRRNVLRTLIVLAQLGCAYGLKDQFAYFSALTGAIGSTMLAYVIPAVLHLKLKMGELGILIVIKDISLIIYGIVGGVSGVYASIISIIKNN